MDWLRVKLRISNRTLLPATSKNTTAFSWLHFVILSLVLTKVCLLLLLLTYLPEERRSMKGWRKEMRPKGFLLSVKPSSSKETAKIIYRVYIGIYMWLLKGHFSNASNSQCLEIHAWAWWWTLTCEWGWDTHVGLQTCWSVPAFHIENSANQTMSIDPICRKQYIENQT